MTGKITLRGTARGVCTVERDGRQIGIVRNNVVATGAIKWSATTADGSTLSASFLTAEDAAKAL